MKCERTQKSAEIFSRECEESREECEIFSRESEKIPDECGIFPDECEKIPDECEIFSDEFAKAPGGSNRPFPATPATSTGRFPPPRARNWSHSVFGGAAPPLLLPQM